MSYNLYFIGPSSVQLVGFNFCLDLDIGISGSEKCIEVLDVKG